MSSKRIRPQRLSLANQTRSLAGRSVWICIGDQDQPVSTEQTIECTRRLAAAKAQVALHVMHGPRGHSGPLTGRAWEAHSEALRLVGGVSRATGRGVGSDSS